MLRTPKPSTPPETPASRAAELVATGGDPARPWQKLRKARPAKTPTTAKDFERLGRAEAKRRRRAQSR